MTIEPDETWWDDDDQDDDEPPEREPMPVFGCACENPLFIDGLCGSCIAYLKEQDRLSQETE